MKLLEFPLKTSEPTLAGEDKERYWVFAFSIDWGYETYTD